MGIQGSQLFTHSNSISLAILYFIRLIVIGGGMPEWSGRSGFAIIIQKVRRFRHYLFIVRIEPSAIKLGTADSALL